MSTPTHYARYQKTDDQIIVKFKDIEIARTTRPVKLQEYHEKYDFEPLYYIPLSDIRQEMLSANQHATTCPIKGKAQYWDLEIDGLTLSNVK